MTEHEHEPEPISSRLDRTFRISVALKGLDGALEVIGGVVLLFVRPETLNAWARTVFQHELSKDPHDFLARHVLHSTGHLTHGKTLFAAIYLLSHGLAKVVLVVAVLKEQLWAYPGMIVLLLLFILYQLYEIVFVKPTLGLSLLTAFDAFVVYLTWREYRARESPGREMVSKGNS
ncbi:MAG: DUF2127 domain-containing protein [Actinomycetota bacterium]|nr:DUF2127 domain-containing protein [Actinomycetota bacterium]